MLSVALLIIRICIAQGIKDFHLQRFHAGGLFFILMIESLRLGEAATVVPFKYSGLVWGLLLGFLIWQHIPDGWMLAGAALVAASGLYLLRVEYRSAGAGSRG